MITGKIKRFDTVNLTPNGPIVNPKTGTKISKKIECTGLLYRGINTECERLADFVKTIDFGNKTPFKKMGIDTVKITKELSGKRAGSSIVYFIKDNAVLKYFSLGDTKAMREFISSLKSKVRL